MRILFQARLPHEPFNAYVKDGTAEARMKKIMDDLKPEAAYFTDSHGHRSAYLIVDLADASGIPSLAEPWFLNFNADVELHIVMKPEDLAKAGLAGIGKKWA
ncbi:hypothetical protein GCM10011507_12600 [Edaphobacter acidisoli]|uniref:Panthothenate synthetase n=1 Tax=Edaphobacter acidisoli TaxID=2040573 RepID=A0A916RN01_9BACT|nr:panthothenate synthetase [Edaphobacter acidisoli]GGA62539.1 hypothetical protein GCM10011507_12600 [Edaphobacter acidisoli]